MAEDVRSRVTAEGGAARGASRFGGLKPCHYHVYTEIPSDFNIWQEACNFGLLRKTAIYYGIIELKG